MKDLKISKELIEEVMKDKGTFETININKNELSTFGVLGHHIFSINIYEFAFKNCKEWALDKGYTIESHTNRSFISKYNREYFSVAKIFKETDSMRINTIDESTEIEAIFLACEYILNNIKQ